MTHLLPPLNEALLSRMNREIATRVRQFVSLTRTGDRFRTWLQADEGVELSGLEAFEVDQPAQHAAFDRMRTPLSKLAESLANNELTAKRFERSADASITIVADVSRSMRYPLRRFYGEEDVGDWQDRRNDLLSSKPALLKLCAASFASAAVRQGFVTRLICTGQGRGHGKDIERRLPRRLQDVAPCVFREIDNLFWTLNARHWDKLPDCGPMDTVDRVLHRPGAFLYLGDLIEPSFSNEPSESETRILSALERASRQRRWAVIRLNHANEVMDPKDIWPGGFDPKDVWEDRCDVDVENPDNTPDAKYRQYQEPRGDRRYRLTRQQEWAQRLETHLKETCREFLSVDSWEATNAERSARRKKVADTAKLRRIWTRLVDR